MGRIRKPLAIILATAFVMMQLLAMTGCGSNSTSISGATNTPVKKTMFVLDTLCAITLYDKTEDKIFEECFAKLTDIDGRMSSQKTASEISKINQNAGRMAVKVSDDTFAVVSEGIRYSKLMGGRFDITVGPLVKLWGIGTKNERIPAKHELKAALALIGYGNVMLNRNDKSVMLKKKGMSLDLGGIAKGYAGDAVEAILKKNGVSHGIIDLGGNILTIGAKPDGSDWHVGIQDPNQPRGGSLGVLSITEKSVVTSGIYERYFEKNGRRYHHIMDTSTGYPVDNEVASVTVVTQQSMRADALAKAFCMGVGKGMEFLKAQKDVEAIFVTRDNKVYLTKGLKSKFEITNSSYKLME